MSVLITNVTKNPTVLGENEYIVTINNKKLCGQFVHNREDGLATCLRKAADAVERFEKENDDKLLAYLNSILDDSSAGRVGRC